MTEEEISMNIMVTQCAAMYLSGIPVDALGNDPLQGKPFVSLLQETLQKSCDIMIYLNDSDIKWTHPTIRGILCPSQKPLSKI